MPSRQYDREAERIEEAFERGDIDVRGFNEEMQELDRDYRAAAEEAAEVAYRREMECW